MGSLVTKLDSNNKVVSISQKGPTSEDPKTKISAEALNEYKENINKNGGTIGVLRIEALKEILKENYDKAIQGLSEDEKRKVPNPNGLPIAIGVGESLSQYGFYTIIEEEPSNPKIMPILIPNSLIKNDKSFIDFIFANFVSKMMANRDVKDIDYLKKILTSSIDGLNQNSTNPQIRLANVLNLMISLGVIFFIISSYSVSKNIREDSNMFSYAISSFIGSFPEDTCYFNTGATKLLQLIPDPCENKKKENSVSQQACPPSKQQACPPSSQQTCPPCPNQQSSSEEITNLKYISGILGILALIFLVLYLTKKTTVIKQVLDSDSDSD